MGWFALELHSGFKMSVYDRSEADDFTETCRNVYVVKYMNFISAPLACRPLYSDDDYLLLFRSNLQHFNLLFLLYQNYFTQFYLFFFAAMKATKPQ